MAAPICTIALSGFTGTLISVECQIAHSLPAIVIVGYANKAVNEAKERIRGAFSSSRIVLPRRRITVNLAPADIPKSESGFDLAIAASILKTTHDSLQIPTDALYFGELGLTGTVRPVRGLIGKILSAKRRGFTTFFIPSANLTQARIIPGITLYAVKTLLELYSHFGGLQTIPRARTDTSNHELNETSHNVENLRVHEVVGQEQAKRALILAAAGGHNVFLSGPPGTGKSMLARSLPELLPPLTLEEILEITHVHSLIGNTYDRLILQRPFRAPHHSTRAAAIIGGGDTLKPGELSLAHGGVLLFDEFLEFERPALEALRQPLEERRIQIARAKVSATFPANFNFIATANPCPCGYYGTEQTCSCTGAQLQAYRTKLSGPLLDRIDIYTDVEKVEHKKLLHKPNAVKDVQDVRSAIQKAHARQHARYQSASTLNAHASNADIRFNANLTPHATATLNKAAGSLALSARAYMRCVKLARTIADLAASPAIQEAHVLEAISFRHKA